LLTSWVTTSFSGSTLPHIVKMITADKIEGCKIITAQGAFYGSEALSADLKHWHKCLNNLQYKFSHEIMMLPQTTLLYDDKRALGLTCCRNYGQHYPHLHCGTFPLGPYPQVPLAHTHSKSPQPDCWHDCDYKRLGCSDTCCHPFLCGKLTTFK
jgi:hypothetical protein